ncbi:hypothetical protein P43SY_010481 [Pythium insidiosum]|uniref:Uncharacterized protein n=1 Tax=Pythium insidiosum TaxID=114742 RepID=A0AAD5Q0Z0_PYTIN|nr:hypothetical protein P43SY_010481 [Pythium insidiosum]
MRSPQRLRHSIGMELQREYLRNARRRARQSRGYFDEDEGDEDDRAIAMLGLSEDERDGQHDHRNAPQDASAVDPLDAFMAGIDAQVTQERSMASASQRPPPREKVSERGSSAAVAVVPGHGH